MLKFIIGGLMLVSTFVPWCCCRVSGMESRAEEEMVRKETAGNSGMYMDGG